MRDAKQIFWHLVDKLDKKLRLRKHYRNPWSTQEIIFSFSDIFNILRFFLATQIRCDNLNKNWLDLLKLPLS